MPILLLTEQTDLAIYRAICDDDADSEGFMHSTLRIVIPGDPINLDQLGCVKERNERAYTCIGVPPETPGASSYIWVFESN